MLPSRHQQALARLGFTDPTPVQVITLPKSLQGESFFAVAPTGTGKTLAYLLPLWHFGESEGSTSLVLVPTRELAYQVSQMARDLDPEVRNMTRILIGGHPLEPQLSSLAVKWRMLLATPGRLIDVLERRPGLIRNISHLVLDEFDKLASMGFQEQIARIRKEMPSLKQTLCFSATAPAEEVAKDLGIGDLSLVDLGKEAGESRMDESFYFIHNPRKKNELLMKAMESAEGQVIVFVRNREKANHLHGLLKLNRLPVEMLHGHLDQVKRARIYQAFKENRFRYLIATDLAARGLDIGNVRLIINYDLPQNYRDYIHRIGRTARAGRRGRCISFAGPDEYIQMRNLERESPHPLPLHQEYGDREKWFQNAKRRHEKAVKTHERAEDIRKQQGLEEGEKGRDIPPDDS